MTPAAIHSPEKTEGQEEEARGGRKDRREGGGWRQRETAAAVGEGVLVGEGRGAAAVGAEREPPPAQPWDAGAAPVRGARPET